MKITKFRRSRTFVHDVKACCLKATVPNSAIPNLAAKRRAKLADNPDFDIFLRSKVPTSITKWQQQMLSSLFEKGQLTVAIEEGMKDYEKNSDREHLLDHEKKNWEDIRRNGVLPHVTLLAVVVDDIKREVILSLSSEAEGNLEEHGIVIYLKDKSWKYDSDHLNDYFSEVEDEESERDFPDFEEEAEEPKPAIANDFGEVTFMVGTWIFDGEANRDWRRKKGQSEQEIESEIRFCDIERRQLEFSEKTLLYWQKYSKWLKPSVKNILRYERHGDMVKVAYQNVDESEVQYWGFVYENDRLRDTSGWIYKRKPDPTPDQSSPAPK